MRVAINGFGRIGRLVFRIIEGKRLLGEDVEIVAVNCSLSNKQFLNLLKYDSVHGTFHCDSSFTDEDKIIINENVVYRFNKRDPSEIDWSLAKAEYIIDCTGAFKTQELAMLHFYSDGVKNVIVSSPSSDLPMYVVGVNEDKFEGELAVSNASCTTNCLGPLIKVINDHFGVEEALMSTIHATTSSQNTIDNKGKNLRVGRTSMNNIIPTSTGAAKCVGKIIPELKGKITGMAFRVPTANVSVVDLTVRVKKETSYDEIMEAIKQESQGKLKGILGYTEEELVSQDFVGNSNSCIVDVKAGIQLNKNFFKIVGWYDNEWGYSHRLVDLLFHIKQ